ncbi:helix-turn-helix transcriptional regulator [Leisingera aquimarina]|uniref:helix-turn-helix transcriptional regulator n=1 Tax=Leisingera aquimarina TaxID=476529 RepID=UPI000489640A|nr:AlpA family phage regulatory protein [Leisingera aquimarina]
MSAQMKIYARIKERRDLFGMSRATVYRRAKEKCFPIYKRNGMSVVKIEEVTAWLEAETLY